MSTRSRKIMFLGSRARPVRKADSLTANCEPTVYTLWDPHHLTALQGGLYSTSTPESERNCGADSLAPSGRPLTPPRGDATSKHTHVQE
jgi:hypothetical protein